MGRGKAGQESGLEARLLNRVDNVCNAQLALLSTITSSIPINVSPCVGTGFVEPRMTFSDFVVSIYNFPRPQHATSFCM